MHISLPEFTLVLLIGPESDLKSDFARKHFDPQSILSYQKFLDLTEDEEDALDTLAFTLKKRLKNRLSTIIDAPLITENSRADFRKLARSYHADLVAIVLDLPTSEYVPSDQNGPRFSQQWNMLAEGVRHLEQEKISIIQHINSKAGLEAVQFKSEVLASNRKSETGSFDIIGDVHGCLDELEELLAELEYVKSDGIWSHPERRRLVFVGDLVDKGPDAIGVWRLVRDMVQDGIAFCVPGNHEDKLKRYLLGRNVKIRHGLEKTVQQLEGVGEEERREIQEWIEALPPYLQLDGGHLVVAHAGIKEGMIGRESGEVRNFCLYGETNGETNEFGLPVRINWAANYKGDALVVYGHTPIPEPMWQANTVNIDTGCVYGGKLTALRYPERTLISVSSKKIYSPPKQPLIGNMPEREEQTRDGLPEYQRLAGRNLISTRLRYFVTLAPESAEMVHALLHASPVAMRYLLYPPINYSAVKYSGAMRQPEHVRDAFNYYKKKGLEQVVMHEMGQGPRVVALVCKDVATARQRFGGAGRSMGAIYGADGFPLPEVTDVDAVLSRWSRSLTEKGFWKAMDSDWVLLEGEWTDEGLVGWHWLAGEGWNGMDRSQLWHREKWDQWKDVGMGWDAPRWWRVEIDLEGDLRTANTQYEEMVDGGAWGVLVRPADTFFVEGEKDLVQPGLKVRGAKGISATYGETWASDPIVFETRRLKDKRMSTLREFALGYEGLARLTEHSEAIGIYECFFTAISLRAVGSDIRL